MSQESMDLVAEGLRAFQATLRAAESAAADFVWDLSTLEDWPDAVQYVGPIISQRGRPKGSQSWVHLRFGVVWTVADGELKRGRVFRTAEEALEAAGLRG
jgi:hypothetical protein